MGGRLSPAPELPSVLPLRVSLSTSLVSELFECEDQESQKITSAPGGRMGLDKSAADIRIENILQRGDGLLAQVYVVITDIFRLSL